MYTPGFEFGSPNRPPAPRPQPPSRAVMSYLIVLPTFNEAQNLGRLAEAVLRQPSAELLIIDDASTDGTSEMADELATGSARVQVIHRAGKLGQGSAYVVGFRRALEREFDLIVQMDCDFSHDPADVPRLLAALAEGEADLAIGSRYAPGGRVVGWGPTRRILSWGGNTYAKFLLGFSVHDWTSGFKAFTRETLALLMAVPDYAEGYGFHVEITYRSVSAGLRAAEVPITFTDRVLGKSKMGHGIVAEAARRVWRLGAERRRSRRLSTEATGVSGDE